MIVVHRCGDNAKPALQFHSAWNYKAKSALSDATLEQGPMSSRGPEEDAMGFSSTTSRADLNSPNRTAAGDVGDNVAALRADIAGLADSVKRLAAEQIGSSVEDVQDKAMEKLGDVEAAIRRNPSQAAMIAAGIGFVVGLILSR
jgi:ElaB/YqjD/DUF883 family membrane-anchored ribosome-binding protein